MKFRSTVTTVCLVAIASAGCEDVVTTPNKVDPAGPRVTEVTLCHFREDAKCFLNATLSAGNSVVLEALATQGLQNITSACTFVWKSNKSSVRVAVNQPSHTAIITANGNAIANGLTITATCNGVSGAFSITVI